MLKFGKVKGPEKVVALESAHGRNENDNPRYKAEKGKFDTAILNYAGVSKVCCRVGDIWYFVADA